MDVYVSKLGVAALLGVSPHSVPLSTPDVAIGKWHGWSPTRVCDGAVSARHHTPLLLLSPVQVAGLVGLSKRRISELRAAPASGFPAPAACIEPPARPRHNGGWDGRIYGWDRAGLEEFINQTGRFDRSRGALRGRPVGSGDYTTMPRCERPRDASVHGKGRLCQAVRRKVDGVWAPACGVHLTAAERVRLGLDAVDMLASDN